MTTAAIAKEKTDLLKARDKYDKQSRVYLKYTMRLVHIADYEEMVRETVRNRMDAIASESMAQMSLLTKKTNMELKQLEDQALEAIRKGKIPRVKTVIKFKTATAETRASFEKASTALIDNVKEEMKRTSALP